MITSLCKKVKMAIILLIVSLFCISSVPFALAEDDVYEWEKGETSDPKKTWTIEFNQPLNAAKVNSTTVYVKDEKNKKVSTTVSLSSDNKAVIVTPKKNYMAGKEYKLYIEHSIVSERGGKLDQSIVFPFTILEEEQEKEVEDKNTGGNKNSTETKEPSNPLENNLVKNINIDRTSYATVITLSTDNSVAYVTANSEKMHYEGENKYRAGIVGLEKDDKLMIRAFDADGKLVFSKEYIVN